MKKTTALLIAVLFMVIGYAAYNATINIYGNSGIAENLSNFNVYFHSIKVNGNEVEGISSSRDSFKIDGNIDGTIEYEIINDSTDYDAETTVECTSDNETTKIITNYDYTGGEQTFIAPENAIYQIELWGAQGATDSSSYPGGYGGYSTGQIRLEQNEKLYIYVGEKGKNLNRSTSKGQAISYPNGGAISIINGDSNNINYSSGGGSTHITTKQGQIDSLFYSKTHLLAVAGGGGGTCTWWGYKESAGSGGGFEGATTTTNYPNGTVQNNNPTGGTQEAQGHGGGNLVGNDASGWIAGKFGIGGGTSTSSTDYVSGAGGGGYFGGGASFGGSGAGGSGYIGNTRLTDKAMYCYKCTESNEVNTKTVSTICTSATPTENCAKSGNGYVRISRLTSNQSLETSNLSIEAQNTKSYKYSNIKSKLVTCKLKVKKLERTEKNNYEAGHIWKYEYSGDEQTFTPPISGVYKLEVWGAQGATDSIKYHGGYGGYSVGQIKLTEGSKLYIYVGEKGKNINRSVLSGEIDSFPNGGSVKISNIDTHLMDYSSGGGSTHISSTKGLIENLENNKEKILVVAGGGGGTCTWWEEAKDSAGSGGGFKGSTTTYNFPNNSVPNNNPTGGSQIAGGTGGGNLEGNLASNWLMGSFGIGGGSKTTNASNVSGGGGGGYFGGGASWGGSGAGGSGYIGNSLLTDKAMYCYNCEESSEESTKTISTTCTSATPTSACAKSGNGYARITLISTD